MREPGFGRIAAAIGDATRSRMLARLLDGRHYTQKELAEHVAVSAATASAHLKKLVDERLVRVRAQGRHRYFALADESVAHALEALSLVADSHEPAGLWSRASMQPLRLARSCYGHLAGELGVELHDGLLRSGWVEPRAATGQDYRLTVLGASRLQAWGIDVPALAGARLDRARGLYACLDWSQRRDHFAGPLAVAMLDHFLARHWLARSAGSRALSLTAAGSRSLHALLAPRDGPRDKA